MFCTVNGISGIRITWAPPAMPALQSDPARVAAHDFHDHDAVMRLGRGVNHVDGIGGGGSGGIEAEGQFGGGKIVVDGLRNANDLHPLLEEFEGDLLRPIAAHGDYRVDSQLLRIADDLIGDGARNFLTVVGSLV
jgi:hypothetical protein